MEKITGGQAIVRILEAEGVKAVFGIPGGHTLGIYDALFDTPAIRHILVRHEQGAANMAAGYAQLTGEPGVVCVTAGPGATNLISGIAEAYIGALPIVIFAGRGATLNAHRGASQEIAQEKIFKEITKWAVRVDRPDLIPGVVRQAFTVARAGKPGPVLIDIPRDVLHQEIEVGNYVSVGPPPRPRGAGDRLRAAADALTNAKRPLIVSGGGAIMSGAWAELRRLAERVGAPVITTLSGRGILPDDHPLAAGGIGHHRTKLTERLLPGADVVIGLGCRFEEQETNWKPSYLPDPAASYIQVDIDGAEIGRSVAPKIAIVGDVRSVLEDLLVALGGGAAEPTPWLAQFAAERQALIEEAASWAGSDQRPLHPLRVFREVQSAIPRDASVAIDVGVIAQGMGGAFPYFRVFEPRSLIVPSSFYGMGFAASALPVARLVRPDKPAVGFVGDGSFQMVMNVLPVAAEFRLAVTWCIFNDRALGSIQDGQRHAFGNRQIATTFEVQPDFAKIAEACECFGEKVTEADRIAPALGRALAANQDGRPAALDFIVAQERLAGSVEFFKR